jgi:hypothetical protein
MVKYERTREIVMPRSIDNPPISGIDGLPSLCKSRPLIFLLLKYFNRKGVDNKVIKKEMSEKMTKNIMINCSSRYKNLTPAQIDTHDYYYYQLKGISHS